MGETEMVDGGATVKVAGLSKSYRRRKAVRGIDLEIKRGEIYGLIGPDGAGKSSLMKAIAGVLTFDKGTVEVFGIHVDSERAAEKIKDRIGFMPQGLGLNLYPSLSIEENIDFFANLRLVPPKDLAERKERLLSMTRLTPFRSRLMKHLSGGMKQKLGLICSLIHEPELLILDEPTTGVDPVSRRDFWGILAGLLHERGITALVSTAYMDEASRFHRLSLLFDGKVLAAGIPEEIRSFVPGSLVELKSLEQTKALGRLKAHFKHVQALGPLIRVFVEDKDPKTASSEVEGILSGMSFYDLKVAEADLEDVFVAILHREHLIEEETGTADPGIYPSSHPAGPDVAIEATGLVRDFDSFRAVDRVSFRIRYGEVFGLLGSNGAGKTTVIKMLTGILPPTAGEGHVAGADMRHAGRVIKERIGYMSQAFSLYQDLTVVENIRLYAGIYGLSRNETRRRTEWIIGMAGLEGHEADQAGELPIGLRQRLALGCSLVHSPKILFLDEPTSGVDPVGRRRLWEIIFRLSREEGVAVLVTTHYMSEAEYCDRIALMFSGRLIADATPFELKREVEDEAGRLLELSTDKPALALERMTKGGYPQATLFGTRIHFFSQRPESDMERIPKIMAEAGISIDSIMPRALSMEDVFVYRVIDMEEKERAQKGGPA